VVLAIGRIPRFPLNRAAMALLGAGLALALGAITFEQAVTTIDLSTIVLLLSMMVINAVLELAGFFSWVGDLVIEQANSPMKLLVLVTLTGGVLSALFINDPVVLMLTPLVCGVTLKLKYKPLPYLVALATASNIGSAATITGSPQNILIGMSSQIPYLAFLARLGPVALMGMLIVIAVVRVIYQRDFGPQPASPAHTDAPPNRVVRLPRSVNLPILRKCLVIIAAMLIAYLAGVEIPLAAYLAACVLLFTRRIKTQKILTRIDWLLLFAGLFVVTGALELTVVSEKLFGLAAAGVAPLALITTVLSNTISNVPAVLLFRPLVPQLPNPERTWLTLAGASTLAGNLTLIGSIANLIVAEQALKFGIRLTFVE